MKSMIINKMNFDLGIPTNIMAMLPYRISDAIRREAKTNEGICEEIRLRRGGASSLTMTGGKNIILKLSFPLSREEIDNTIEKLSGGSLYAHSETIKQGYISLDKGVRAGVCGRAAYDGGKMIGVSDISGICIRIPHTVNVDADIICSLLYEMNFSEGVLIYSPPGEGKTTLLRAISAEISKKGNIRVVVVDSRGELEYGISSSGLCIDILSGYSKAEGIEIALRTLNAQLIVCDEIGSREDISAICDAAVGGAALLASAHASDMNSLLCKRNIRTLIDAGVFGALVGVSRSLSGYEYNIARRGEW